MTLPNDINIRYHSCARKKSYSKNVRKFAIGPRQRSFLVEPFCSSSQNGISTESWLGISQILKAIIFFKYFSMAFGNIKTENFTPHSPEKLFEDMWQLTRDIFIHIRLITFTHAQANFIRFSSKN